MPNEIKKFVNTPFEDHRGLYWTTWEQGKIKNLIFNHDKCSSSKKNVLRGLHSDTKTWKLISCIFGKIFVVVVNNKKNSENYLKWKSWVLSPKNGLQLLIPPNYANGHLCLTNECVLHYKLSYPGNYVDSKDQTTLKWNDPKLRIIWPIENPILSDRDKDAKLIL